MQFYNSAECDAEDIWGGGVTSGENQSTKSPYLISIVEPKPHYDKDFNETL